MNDLIDFERAFLQLKEGLAEQIEESTNSLETTNSLLQEELRSLIQNLSNFLPDKALRMAEVYNESISRNSRVFNEMVNELKGCVLITRSNDQGLVKSIAALSKKMHSIKNEINTIRKVVKDLQSMANERKSESILSDNKGTNEEQLQE